MLQKQKTRNNIVYGLQFTVYSSRFSVYS